jgi:hypothetical protein
MKRTLVILTIFFSCFIALTLWAQKKKDTKKAETAAPAAKPKYALLVPAYLGHTSLTGGTLPKPVFDSLLKQGISAKDSSGNAYTVKGFRFNYAELNLYEDSVGNLVKLMDYFIEFCPGDTITSTIAGSIYQRTKPGDSVYIDDIQLLKPDGGSAAGKQMKFVITK